MTNNFYKAFEDAFRGDRETIMERLKVYLPLIELLKTLTPTPSVLDVGCGRGEWLQLLNQNGFHTHGVDLDESMLENAREYDLSVECRDAVDYLRSLPDASLELISGFHIAEHLPFGVLMELVIQSLRVLRDGGMLILETPNPENISVGSNTFYTDPTHERPLPPALLSFLPEYAGFGRTTIFRLNERPLSPDAPVSLFDVITGASPDYAVIAQKKADPAVLERFEREFFTPRGLSMDALALRSSKRFERAESEISQLYNRLEEKERQIREVNHRFDEVNHRFRTLEEHLTLVHTHLDAVNARFEWEIEKIHGSYSWKITAPLRYGAKALREVRTTLKSAVADTKEKLKVWLINHLKTLIAYIKSSPRARQIAFKIAHRFPKLTARIKNRLSSPPSQIVDTHLTPRGERIFHDLKHAIEEARRSR